MAYPEQTLHRLFDEMVVYKDFRNNALKNLGVPSFLRDWLLKKYQAENGEFDIEEVQSFIQAHLPGKDGWNAIKSHLFDGEQVNLLAKIVVDIDIQSGQYRFELPDYGLTLKETLIDDACIEKNRDALTKAKSVWGQISLVYRQPTDPKKKDGRIVMRNYRDFCPYVLDLDYYKDMSHEFSVDEWIDVLLGAIDYNASGYNNPVEKLAVLSRLLVFVEKNLNIVELAPKGTGKSYLFGNVSKYGIILNSKLTRASLFYNIANHRQGAIFNNDFVAVDEVQSSSFGDIDEMRTAFKGYLESGSFTATDGFEATSSAGLILLGNIPCESMNENANFFDVHLPEAYHESALIDRFHGFIKGWDIPRMHEGLKMCGWALNTEYFSSIMHMLRNDVSYDAIVDELVEAPPKADTRDTTAVKRLAAAWLKLLFPYVRCADDVDRYQFRVKCLQPACDMRYIIRRQLGMMDAEFSLEKKPFPEYRVIQ